MRATYLGNHRKKLTINTIVLLFAVVAIITSVIAIVGVKKIDPLSAMVGSSINKSIGGERKLNNASSWNGTSTIWTKGSGTYLDPYLIESAQHLAYLSEKAHLISEFTYFKQTVDIDLSATLGYTWTPIGYKEKYISNAYYGLMIEYDGAGHMIGNVSVGPTSIVLSIFYDLIQEDDELSGDITCGSVRNLTVDWSNQGETSATAAAGICLYGKVVNSTVQNLYIDGVSATNSNIEYAGITLAGYVEDCKVFNFKVTNINISRSDEYTETYVEGILFISGINNYMSWDSEQPYNAEYCEVYNMVVENIVCTGDDILTEYSPTLGFVCGITAGDGAYGCVIDELTITANATGCDFYFAGIGSSGHSCIVKNVSVSGTNITGAGLSFAGRAHTNISSSDSSIRTVGWNPFGVQVQYCKLYNATISVQVDGGWYQLAGIITDAYNDIVIDNIIKGVTINLDIISLVGGDIVEYSAYVGGLVAGLTEWAGMPYNDEGGQLVYPNDTTTIVERNYGEVDINISKATSRTFVGGVCALLSPYAYETSAPEFDTYGGIHYFKQNYVQGKIAVTSSEAPVIGGIVGRINTWKPYPIDSMMKPIEYYIQENTFIGEIDSNVPYGLLLYDGTGDDYSTIEYVKHNLVRVIETNYYSTKMVVNSVLDNTFDSYVKNIITIVNKGVEKYYITDHIDTLTEHTLQEMQTFSTYSSWSDFQDYWTIEAGKNDGIPYLRWAADFVKATGHSGSGTQQAPYIIDSVQTFLAFADYYNNNSSEIVPKDLYWLIDGDVNELDLSSLGSWRPIGYDADHPFTGHLLGNQTNVTNLMIDKNYIYAGLFGNIASGASIEWLAVYGDVDYDIASYAGGLAGYVADGATISNCYFMGNINGYLETTRSCSVGGLIGAGAEDNVTSSYAVVTHSIFSTNIATTENIEALYGVNAEPSVPVGDMKTKSTYEQFGFIFSESSWKIDTQNYGYPYFNLTSSNSFAFSIIRNVSGNGNVSVAADNQMVEFMADGITSVNNYTKGATITVEARANTGYVISSLIINGRTYINAENKDSFIVDNISTNNQLGDFIISVVFASRKTLTITNGSPTFSGTVSYYNDTKTTNSTHNEISIIDGFISGTTITTTIDVEGPLVSKATNPYIKSIEINGILCEFKDLKLYVEGEYYATLYDGYNNDIEVFVSGQSIAFNIYQNYCSRNTKYYYDYMYRVSYLEITFSMTSDIDIEVCYSAEQFINTYITIVGADGVINRQYDNYNTPFYAPWGHTINALTKDSSYATDYEFVGWMVNGEILSTEDTFSTQVTGNLSEIEQLWAILYNVTLEKPIEIESIQVAQMFTGLIYNLNVDTKLMAGDWLVTVPTGMTLKLNGVEIVPDSQGRHIVSITSDCTITLS